MAIFSKLRPVVLFILLTLAIDASADKVCLKVSLSKGKIKQTVKNVLSTANCPGGFKTIVDTALLTGPQGPTGATGATGAEGPFPNSLPSGKTITGTYALGGQAVSADDDFFDSISFSYPLAAAPTVEVREIGGATTANCPGSAAEPSAAPGFLCVYEGYNRASLFIPTNRKAGSLSVRNFSTLLLLDSPNNSLKGGASIQAEATDPGFMVSKGSWAVTAP